jgi:methyl-accepting chemotaxis protein
MTSMLLEEDIPLAGGAAADGFRMQNVSWIGCGKEAASNALAIAMIFSKTPIGIGVCHGHVPLTDPLTVTKSEGGVVFEIEGRPAWDVWDEKTRPSPIRGALKDITQPGPDGINGFLGIFELGLASGSEFKVRAPLMKLDGGAIGFACGIPTGTAIQIMESTPDRQVASARVAAQRAVAQLGGERPKGALVIDCACRKLLLGARLGEAVSAMREELGGVPLAGFESYGEIALQAGDLSGFHNTTTVLVAFA